MTGRLSSWRDALVAASLAGTLSGCAALMPVTTPAAPAAMPAARATAPGPRASAPIPVPAPRLDVDSTAVSAVGSAVLATIAEPLPEAERVPPPVLDQVRATIAAPSLADPAAGPGASARDTAAAAAPEDTTSADVPVPAPTSPLGDRPGTLARLLAPDTSAAPPSAAPVTPPAAPAAVACWRIQVGAPADRVHAANLRKAAESQLLVPFVVELDKRLYKVRTQACVGAEAAESLKRRASLAGFTGVFKFDGGTQ